MERDVSVQEVMDREFVGVSESDDFTETVRLMLEAEVESVVVLRGSDPVGVVTERDALTAMVDDLAETAADAMTETVPTVSPDHTIAEAADEMSAAATKRVLVADGDETVGVVSEHDLITTSPFAPAVGTDHTASSPELSDRQPVAAGTSGPGDLGEGGREAEYEDQSICEACGSLARDLRGFNGQLLCADCRDI